MLSGEWTVESGATVDERHDPARRKLEHFDDWDEARGCLDAHAETGRSAALGRTAVFEAEDGAS